MVAVFLPRGASVGDGDKTTFVPLSP
jgi:hypothetical protein